MKLLEFKTRDSINRDGKITTVISNILKADQAMFFSDKGAKLVDSNWETRYYPYPYIEIAKNIDSILVEKKDISSIYELYCKSIVIHELVHYLQKTIPTISPAEKIRIIQEGGYSIYVNEPAEKEAFAVAAYYFIEIIDPHVIRRILSYPNESIEHKLQALINAYYLILYPATPLIFPENPIKYR